MGINCKQVKKNLKYFIVKIIFLQNCKSTCIDNIVKESCTVCISTLQKNKL